ncbi:beta-lactamase [Bacillus coahuilensis m2-6]|uniref:Beta-lactamase n=1 Tax=Bacillus coahuilensis p1.1.43 TaxID=1150625 RepID=A0A147K832_9BACI|nr:MBL fold metallo-hydrolase [Bacillus coahuilensis]KUP06315.1 beta-lactamase [Bacillus coahuilensis p1.1.43]KUP07463.1 beta-lactamase [Bacillus coahuilensis m2-6]
MERMHKPEWNLGVAKIVIPTPFAVGDVNAYLIKGDALTLLDAGPNTPEAKEAIQAGLKELGLRLDDVEQIILTHHHPDHAGGLEFFSKDIPIYGHKYNNLLLHRTDEFYTKHKAFYEGLYSRFGLPPEWLPFLDRIKGPLKFMTDNRQLTGIIGEGDALPGLAGWVAIETLGHAQSHLSFYQEQEQTLLAGDHLIKTISSNPIIELPFEGVERPKSLLQYNESMKKLLPYDIKLAYSGHGIEMSNVHSLIEHRLERQHVRAMKVKEMIKDYPRSVFEVCQSLFPEVYKKELWLTISETIGQLDYLESIGEVRFEKNNENIDLYFAI